MTDYLGGMEEEQASEKAISCCSKDRGLRKRAITGNAWINDLGPGHSVYLPGPATLGGPVIGLTAVRHYRMQGSAPGKITEMKNSKVAREDHDRAENHIGLLE